MNSKTTTLIPRDVIFGNPDISSVSISDDGKHIAYMAPLDGVMNVYFAPTDNLSNAKAITRSTKRGIAGYFWANNNTNIIYFQDNDGDENFAVYSVNINDTKDVQLTQKPHKASVLHTSDKFPDEMLMMINSRRADYFDVYRINITNGQSTLIFENNEFGSFMSDDNFNLRFAFKSRDDGGQDVHMFDEKLQRVLFDTIDYEDALTTDYLAFNKDADKLHLIDSRGRNTAALFQLDIATKAKTMLAEDAKADITGAIINPIDYHIEAAVSNYQRVNYQILDQDFKSDYDYLASLDQNGELRIVSRSSDNNKWIIAFLKDDAPLSYYFYDRPSKRADFLFFNNKKLAEYKLQKMESIIIKARDGLEMVAYLTKPNINGPVPLILNVHGGPRARDSWGYDARDQWLANRGYAVINLNYRGSTGFGKDFIAKGDGEWSGKMHDDLIDAVNWAIENKITEKDKVAIFGGSYGGYAALAGVTFTPDVFACAVDLVGPSNLVTLLDSIPPYWKPFRASMVKMLGSDSNTEEGKQALLAKSPISHVDKISKPLLIGQGANDPRVKQAESDQIVNAMVEKKIPVTYVLYPDEGHGFARPENRLSFYAIVESFLGQILHGKVEPFDQEMKNSSHEIIHGKEFLKLD